MAECQGLIEKLKRDTPLPADFLDDLLAGGRGLLGRCGGYLSGYSKDSPVVSGCIMGHLRNPNIVFPPTLFLWANGLPTGAKPRSLNEALRMKREMTLPAPQPPPVPPVPPMPPPPPRNILVDKSLADLGFEFRFVDEWKEVETVIEKIRNGSLHTIQCNWSYKLTQNGSGSYTVEWRWGNETGKLLFPVVENQYPKNLVLVLFGEAADIQGMELKLK